MKANGENRPGQNRPSHNRPGRGSVIETLTRVCLGPPLANRESRQREIGVLEGVPALGLDGLSSSA